MISKDSSVYEWSVVALGALCALDSVVLGGSPGINIREFAELDDGQRIFWREDRGWFGKSVNSPWPVTSGRDLTHEVLEVTQPDDCRIDSYVECALEGLRGMALNIDPASVYSAPFRVEFDVDLKEELSRLAQFFDPTSRYGHNTQRPCR